MSLYWFAGYLDQTYTINPIRLRGYDATGNLLYSVRDNAIREHDLSALAGTGTELSNQRSDFADPYRFISGYDEWGTAKTLCAYNGWFEFEVPQRLSPIRAIAVDSDGWVYCAMERVTAYQLKSGVTEAQMRSMRATAVADGVAGGAYHGWYSISPNPPYGYYYQGLVSRFVGDNDRYDRLYIDFFRVYRQNGDRVNFPELHGRPVYAVATDDTYFYLAGEGVGEDQEYLRKYDKTGSLQWSADQPAWMGAEPARYVPATIVFGVYVPEYWQFEYRRVHNILIDGSGNVYLSGHAEYGTSGGGLLINRGWLRKYNSSGVLQWERRCPNFGITNVVTDGTLFYVAFYRWVSTGFFDLPQTYRIDTTDYYFDPVNELPVEIVAWDADGDIVRTAARPTTLYGGYYYLNSPQTGAQRLEYHDGVLYLSTALSSDPDADVVIAYDTTDLSETTDTLSPAQYLSATGYGVGFTRFCFDANGNRVFPKISSYEHFYRYDDAGTQQWTDRKAAEDSLPLGWGDNGGGQAADLAIVATPSLPMLALGIGLGTPDWQGDRYTAIDGLGLSLALGTPSWMREYAGAGRLPEVYGLTLAGTPTLTFAVTSLTLRRTAVSRSLSAVIVPPSVETLTALEARLGDTLTLSRGVRFADGSTQLETMMEVPLATVRSDRGTRSFSISLEGAAEETENIPHTRTLAGVSYRNATSGGARRRVRCAMDTYLRPGYTALFGAESMTVGDITISISPVSGVMEVAEASA